MITCALEPLLQQRAEQLGAYLKRPELQTLKDVVRAQVQRYQASALQDVLSASSGNLKMESGNANLQKAQRYHHFLEVLDELLNQSKPYEIAKLS